MTVFKDRALNCLAEFFCLIVQLCSKFIQIMPNDFVIEMYLCNACVADVQIEKASVVVSTKKILYLCNI